MATIRLALVVCGVALVIGLVASQAPTRRQMTITVDVPRAVADWAARRAGGDSSAAAPVLMLEGVRLRLGERLTIRVLDPAGPDTPDGGNILGTASMVGAAQAPPADATKVDLAIPLNDKSAPHLAKPGRVSLRLRIERRGESGELEFDRAYFVEKDGPP